MKRHYVFITLLFAVFMFPFVEKGAAEYVLPEGGKITSGSGTISNDGAGTLTVDLTSARTTIEWQSFNVGYNATVNFVFEGGNVMVDNRLMGSLVIQGICGEPNRAVWERRRTGDNYVWEPAYIQGKKNSVISGKVTVNGVAPKKGQVSMLSTDDVTGRYRSTGCAICVSRAHINNKGGTLANLCAEPRRPAWVEDDSCSPGSYRNPSLPPCETPIQLDPGKFR